MDGVGTPIIGRPRPLPGHDTPNPAYHPHTLNYEEPVMRILHAVHLDKFEVVISREDITQAQNLTHQVNEVLLLRFGGNNAYRQGELFT